MLQTKESRREIGRWIIGLVTICSLIYLGIRHIKDVATVLGILGGLIDPILVGTIMALILNVPMGFLERFLFGKCGMKRGSRSLAILLSLVLIAAIFIGISILVIPELVNAVQLLIDIVEESLEQLSQMNTESNHVLGQYLQNVDWNGLKLQVEHWFDSQSKLLLSYAMNMAGAFAENMVTLFIGLIFSIYILSGKEKFKAQACRLIKAWIPNCIGNRIIHVADICNSIFKKFIAGQATEAVVLGSLCFVGMAILRIPYAPMVGALVGVTALIPIIGAFVGLAVGAVMIITVNPLKALIFVAFFLVLQQIEGNLIYPRVVGSKINLPAIWVLAAVTIGGNLGGPLGMLLGVPAMSSVYALLREATVWREEKLVDLNENRNRISKKK